MGFLSRWFDHLAEPDREAEARAEAARLTVAALLEQTRNQMAEVKEREERIHDGRRQRRRPNPA